MARVARAPVTLIRSRSNTTETGESREVDIEVARGSVTFTLRDANALTIGTKGDSPTGGQVVGPFHRLEVDEASLRGALGCL